jgi:putative ABC transport system permease protein
VNCLIKESLELSLFSIRHRKISSALTILGIVIGISAIIGLVSIGQGLQQSITKQLESFGPDKLIVSPGSAGATPVGAAAGAFSGSLSEDDVKKIEKISGVKSAAGVLLRTLPVTYKKEVETTYVIGIKAKEASKIFLDINAFDLDSGRYLKEGESGVADIGSAIAKDTFEKEIGIGDTITIMDKKFKVIGIMKSIGNRQDDSQIYMPLADLKDLIGGDNSISIIFVKVSDTTRISQISDDIQKLLDKEYGKKSYSVTSSEQIAESVNSIFSLLSFVLGGIASISLVVAGVGISNTMFTSVIERTKEIGVMKAIGATNYNVMEIFLVESALLGMIGGAVGVVVGFLLSQVITIFAGQILPVTFEAVVTPEMVVLSLSFSIAVGVVSGLWPARRAARLQPVEALRYE